MHSFSTFLMTNGCSSMVTIRRVASARDLKLISKGFSVVRLSAFPYNLLPINCQVSFPFLPSPPLPTIPESSPAPVMDINKLLNFYTFFSLYFNINVYNVMQCTYTYVAYTCFIQKRCYKNFEEKSMNFRIHVVFIRT